LKEEEGNRHMDTRGERRFLGEKNSLERRILQEIQRRRQVAYKRGQNVKKYLVGNVGPSQGTRCWVEERGGQLSGEKPPRRCAKTLQIIPFIGKKRAPPRGVVREMSTGDRGSSAN